jgi:hypothetical protein
MKLFAPQQAFIAARCGSARHEPNNQHEYDGDRHEECSEQTTFEFCKSSLLFLLPPGGSVYAIDHGMILQSGTPVRASTAGGFKHIGPKASLMRDNLVIGRSNADSVSKHGSQRTQGSPGLSITMQRAAGDE